MPTSAPRLSALFFCVESCVCLISLFSLVRGHVDNYLEDYDATTNRYNDVLKIGQNGSETHGVIWPTRTHTYRQNMNCSVKLEVVAGHIMYLTFTDFYLPCERGYFKITGQENTITCCYPGPNDSCNMKQLKSASNWLKVLFITYNSSMYDTYGFQIDYQENDTVPPGSVALIVSIAILGTLILAVVVFFIHEYIKKHKTKRQQRRPGPETASAAAREPSTVHYNPPSHSSSTTTGSTDVVEFGGAFPSPPMYNEIITDQPPPAYSQCVEVSDK